MKKYDVIFRVDGQEFGFTVLARNYQSACNKAVRYAQSMTGDKMITVNNLVTVEYLGFYLSRVFVSVK